MAAKPKTQNTLLTAFLNVAACGKPEIHEIAGLGKIGLKGLSIGSRDEWSTTENHSTIFLIQNTVCDPETGELVLKGIDVERLKELPASIVDLLVPLIFKQNGFKTVAEVKSEAESQELKNSEAGLN